MPKAVVGQTNKSSIFNCLHHKELARACRGLWSIVEMWRLPQATKLSTVFRKRLESSD